MVGGRSKHAASAPPWGPVDPRVQQAGRSDSVGTAPARTATCRHAVKQQARGDRTTRPEPGAVWGMLELPDKELEVAVIVVSQSGAHLEDFIR